MKGTSIGVGLLAVLISFLAGCNIGKVQLAGNAGDTTGGIRYSTQSNMADIKKLALRTLNYRKTYFGKADHQQAFTISKEILKKVIAPDECNQMRIYLARSEDEDRPKIHLVLVGVDSQGKDLVPRKDKELPNPAQEYFIAETADRCPHNCDQASPLYDIHNVQ